jgi:hypothetical protein
VALPPLLPTQHNRPTDFLYPEAPTPTAIIPNPRRLWMMFPFPSQTATTPKTKKATQKVAFSEKNSSI